MSQRPATVKTVAWTIHAATIHRSGIAITAPPTRRQTAAVAAAAAGVDDASRLPTTTRSIAMTTQRPRSTRCASTHHGAPADGRTTLKLLVSAASSASVASETTIASRKARGAARITARTRSLL